LVAEALRLRAAPHFAHRRTTGAGRCSRSLVSGPAFCARLLAVDPISAELPQISSDPSVLGGKPCVRGTRLSVEFILELLASGATEAKIAAAYPQLSAEAVRSAIIYAARALKNEVVWDVKIPA
jgi:uncharacterized protein (DUF433 family)